MKKAVKFFGVFFAVLLALNIAVNAQIPASNQLLRVTVTDAQGQVIVGANCILTQNKKIIAQAQTDVSGMAIFKDAADGIYELKIAVEGFEKFEKTNVKISSDTPLEISAILNVAGVSAQVNVESATDNVNTIEDGSSPADNVRRKTIERLPLATKRIDEAIPLVPGVFWISQGFSRIYFLIIPSGLSLTIGLKPKG